MAAARGSLGGKFGKKGASGGSMGAAYGAKGGHVKDKKNITYVSYFLHFTLNIVVIFVRVLSSDNG